MAKDVDTKSPIFQIVFNKFLEKTIIEGKSCITKTDSPDVIFSKENLEKTEDLFINSDKKFDKSEECIKNSNNQNIKHIFTNLMYLRYFPILDTTIATKTKNINPFELIFTEKPFDLGLETIQKENEELTDLFPCCGISKYGQSQKRYEEIVELIFLFDYLREKYEKRRKEIKTNEEKLADLKVDIINWVFDENSCKSTFCQKWNSNHQIDGKNIDTNRHLAIDHILLYLCNPQEYSHVCSMSNKQMIVKNLYNKYVQKDVKITNDMLQFKNIDQYIKEIIDKIKDDQKLKGKFDESHLSYILWEDDYYKQWNGGYVANAYEILTKYQKQVILYGAPGTGKTYAAEQIIKEFIYDAENNGCPFDIKLDEYKYQDNYDWTKDDSKTSDIRNIELDGSFLKKKKVIWEMVQFNQSYSYEDFIEGLRPKDSSLKIVHGIFKRFAKVAAKDENKEKKFIFIIDEINRGKIDKIFGELLYLLEYRDKNLRLHYSNVEFAIPENVYIIGTMNTADKSIALLDVALRRRFWFVRCAPKREVLCEEFGISYDDELKINADDEPENIKKLAIKLFDWLNGKENAKGKLDELGSDADELKIGHSYFLKLAKNDITFSDLKNIWFYSVVPLIEEYCGFDKNRVEELLKMGNNNNLSQKEHFKLDKLQGTWK